ncbi:putative two component signal transduction histidine kinase [Synechococcus sp. A15-62]|uniref:sensor histidine kinase n=1 Tax=Synechococcus sp. A15-62 TaxID=1050657 RepID=UPI001646FA15|nr:HAMP domain-containing histidine kinase [Synechococcus sp. A15-62]QNI99294.1 putative two component signal transduction histidine kinase [Synechococcus sp. A15-62]
MTGPSFTDLRQRLAQDVPQGRCDEIGVRRLWWAALETLQQDLLERGLERGIWLAAPLPALYEPELLQHLQGWVWAPDQLDQLSPHPTALPGQSSSDEPGSLRGFQRLSLRPDDGDDPLLLVITPEVQVALALHGPAQKRQLLMRCDPATLSDVLVQLGGRLEHQSPAQAEQLRKALESIGSLQSNAAWSEQFWPRLTERLTGTAPGLMLQPIQAERPPEAPSHGDLNLLEAITHEVRTPLATIRTLIRSLLRRKDLADVVVNRLRQIDVECSEQIDRFGLIFHAAELQREPNEANLARTDLQAMLSALAPSWTEQLDRRGIALELDLSADLPAILSDSRRLEPMLGGLIDRSTRGLPSGSQLTLHLQAAGPRVKLQLHVEHPDRSQATEAGSAPQRENVGTVLSWDPSTGSLQLSQDATRQMMASLGGRYQPRRDRDITVFFPVHTPGE